MSNLSWSEITDIEEEQTEDIIKSIRKNEGITLKFVKKDSLQEIVDDKWYLPALPDETRIVESKQLEETLKHFIVDYEEILHEESMYLGVWLNPDTDQYYFDVNTAAANEDEAIELAKSINTASKRQVLAIHNPARDKTIYLEEV